MAKAKTSNLGSLSDGEEPRNNESGRPSKTGNKRKEKTQPTRDAPRERAQSLPSTADCRDPGPSSLSEDEDRSDKSRAKRATNASLQKPKRPARSREEIASLLSNTRENQKPIQPFEGESTRPMEEARSDSTKERTRTGEGQRIERAVESEGTKEMELEEERQQPIQTEECEGTNEMGSEVQTRQLIHVFESEGMREKKQEKDNQKHKQTAESAGKKEIGLGEESQQPIQAVVSEGIKEMVPEEESQQHKQTLEIEGTTDEMGLGEESQHPVQAGERNVTKEIGPEEEFENQQLAESEGMKKARPEEEIQQPVEEFGNRQNLEAREPTPYSSDVECLLRQRYTVEPAKQISPTKQRDVQPLQGKPKIDSNDSAVWEAVYRAGARGSEPFPYEHPDMSTIRAEIEKRTGSAVLQDVEENCEQQLDNFLMWLYYYLVKRKGWERKQPIESISQKKGVPFPVLHVIAIAILAFLFGIGIGIFIQLTMDSQSPVNVKYQAMLPHDSSSVLQNRPPITRDINLDGRMKKLRVMFSQQDPMLWSAMTHDFSDEEMNKISLLVIDIPSDQSTAQAFALALSWLFTREHFHLNPSQFTSLDKTHAKLLVEDVLSTLGDKPKSLVIINSAENMPMYIIDSLQRFCSSLPIERSIVLTAPDTTPSVPLPGCGKKTILRVQPETALPPLPPSIQPADDHHTALNAIREVFGSQSARVWQAIEAVLTEHRADGPPRKPAILVIGAPPGAHRTADLLAQALAKIYSEQPLMVDSHQFSHVDADRAKLHIDRTLDSTFSGEVRSAVFTRVDSLPSATAMIFHSYCDHDDAQFKNAAYFMTVHCSDDVDANAPPKAQEEAILDYLKRSWSDLHEEKRGPLLSRIASMVAVVRAEKNMEIFPPEHS